LLGTRRGYAALDIGLPLRELHLSAWFGTVGRCVEYLFDALLAVRPPIVRPHIVIRAMYAHRRFNVAILNTIS